MFGAEVFKEHSTLPHAYSATSSELRPVAGLSPSNASAQVTKPSYQSPYAPSNQSSTSVSGPRLDDTALIRSVTTPLIETTNLETSESGSLPHRGYLRPRAPETESKELSVF
jgi:hypothetical protein